MFLSLLKLVVESSFKPENAISGFKASGLFPLSFDKIAPKLKQGNAFNLANTQETPTIEEEESNHV